VVHRRADPQDGRLDGPPRRVTGTEIEFSGFHRKKGFLVGYGMGYGEAFRQLPEIYAVPHPGCRKHSDGGRR
jgi:hypothetical protein